MKCGIHVGFDPQTSNLKFFVDQVIGFREIGGYSMPNKQIFLKITPSVLHFNEIWHIRRSH